MAQLASVALCAPLPSTAQRASATVADGENKWVAFPPPDQQGYLYGFIYLDPAAGFTIDIGGSFVIDSEGKYVQVPGSSPSGYRRSVRLTVNRPVLILPTQALDQLGLTPPDWLEVYRDASDPVTRNVRRGHWLNAIGASAHALTPLEEASKARPDSPGLAFELAYAYNVLGRFDRAAEIAASALQREPSNWLVCKEAAFANMKARRFDIAAEQYKLCIAITPEGDSNGRAEAAYNLANVHRELADRDQCEQWRAKAAEWAPEGSELRKAALQALETPSSCAK